MYDSYGRHIHYIRVSVTDRCNLRCTYCMPEEGVDWLPHSQILTLEDMAKVVRAAAGLGFDKVRLTGGEPLVRKGFPELVSMIAAIPGITTIGMTTNGTLLAPVAAELASRGLSSVNVSLDTMDEARYALISRGGQLEEALAGIRAARAAGLPVKLNTVVGIGDDPAILAAVESFAATEGCVVQTIRRYRLDEAKFDDERFMRPPPCASCDRIRLLANGQLKPCLHGDASLPVDWNDIASSIVACINMKPSCGASASTHVVSAIGG
ncbi:MAG: GTP 3',8-cyclase MoaA [Clostridia bacterium]|jgi:cyclic pyranopterin phosphate synthase|nr:radical SAM protein [Spirochaetia bacterium]